MSVSTEEIVIPWGDIELAGTLYRPAAPPPHPAVLLLQGSGPADRDSGGFFPPIRAAFLARGIATFSYDKPGIGASTGDWRHHALTGRAEQAGAVLARLRATADIDGRRTGIWGHSQGGWVVQMVAAREPDLAFAIANSGPAIGPEQQDRYGWAQTLRAGGAAEQDVAAALDFLRAVHQAALRGDAFAEVEERLVRDARGQSWYGYLELEDATDWAHERLLAQEAYEPLGALARVRCPFLAVFGARDPLLPAWESARMCGQALAEAGNSDATVVVFPRGNHRIQLDAPGHLPGYTGQFVPGYLDLLGDWARHRVALP